MSRGRPKQEPQEEKPSKFTRSFTGEDLDTIWHYDLNIAKSPIKVEIKYHKTPKQFAEEVKQLKQIKKQNKQTNEFFKNKPTGPTRSKTRGRKKTS